MSPPIPHFYAPGHPHPHLLCTAQLCSRSHTIGGGPASPPQMPRAPPVALETANPPPAASNWSPQRPGKAGGTPEPPGSCSLETEGRDRTWAPVAPSWSSIQLSVGRLIATSRLESDGLLGQTDPGTKSRRSLPPLQAACMPSFLYNLPVAFSPSRTRVPQRRHRRLKSEPGGEAPGGEHDSPPPPWGSTQVLGPSDLLSLSPPPTISFRWTGNTCLYWLAPSFCSGASLVCSLLKAELLVWGCRSSF